MKNSFIYISEAEGNLKTDLTDEDIYKLCEEVCGDVKTEEVLKNKKLLDILNKVTI
jgi:hypothetical protein